MQYKFSIIGDPHYVRDDSHCETFAGRTGYKGEIADLQRCIWTRDHILPEIMTAIREETRPDALFVLGDVVQGNCDTPSACRRELADARKLLEQAGCPIYVARGNHDAPEMFAEIFPCPGMALGRFSRYLRHDGISFLIVDYKEVADSACRKNIMDALTAIPASDRIFILAHQPAVLVARAFFADRRFLSVAREWAGARIADCWFGGHTHEQIFCRTGPVGRRTLQAVSSVLASEGETPMPLEFSRNLLVAPEDYYYGLHENTCPSWLNVTVENGHVTLSHRTLSGEFSRFTWDNPGEFKFIPSEQLLQLRERPRVTEADLRRIRSADFLFATHDCRDDGKEVLLNDALVGTLPMSGAYAGHFRLVVPPELVSMTTTVRITNPANDSFVIGGLMIRAVLDDARIVYSSLSPKIYSYTDKWDDWCTPLLERVPCGKDVMVRLSFT